MVEPDDFVVQSLTRYNLQSPTGLIRLMIQQSNCLIVVERGVGMQNMMQERQLAQSGALRQNSNVGGGQMVTDDFIPSPSVVFSENNAGGIGAGIGRLFGERKGGALGARRRRVATLSKGDECVYMGDERDGFVKVESAQGGGWVKKVLVAP